MRDGNVNKIDATEVVVGDIIYLNAGEKIVADGEIIDGEIFVDQSPLNGESVEVRKSPGGKKIWDLAERSKVFRGSSINSGSGVMRAERVGANTFYGMVATDVQSETRESPLKLRLHKLASQISKIGYVMAVIVAVIYVFSSLVVNNEFDYERIVLAVKDYKNLISMLSHAVTLMITVIVVSAPEGLPMMITVVLSANMNKLIKNNILVKRLVGIETAGSMNILFTDKTGTITEGKPKCEKIICDSGEFNSPSSLRRSGNIYEILCISAQYNTDSKKENGIVTGGNSTDRAVLDWFKNEEEINATVVEKQPFTSESKRSSIKLKNGKTIVKGAAEIILSSCDKTLKSDGTRALFEREKYFSEYRKASCEGARAIAVAMLDEGEASATFVALIIMKDKIKNDVKKSVGNIIEAGIQVVMVTGDSVETASAIASECGILSRYCEGSVISANEMSNLSDKDLKKALPKIKVVARALPRDKMRLVRIAQELNQVVGMTGDGINDAPSLKLADVGFAMGSGTDIAKSAADVVILDDSISAIGKTVLFGRTIFKSIRKFITFQLIMNLAACGISIIGQLIGVETPITIIQMLWVNIIMDTLGGLAFAGEPASLHYMKEKPKSRDEQILSADMINQIGYTGLYTLILSVFFLSSPIIKKYYNFYDSSDEFFTAFYALFIFSGIANCFTSRSERLRIMSDIGKNITFILIMLGISLIQIAMIYFGGDIFRCVPLSIGELCLALSMALTVIPFDCIRRIVKKLG